MTQTKEGGKTFNWTVDERTTWPPHGRPRPPLGPTAIEMLRSCPLRLCFAASTGYERRTDFAARIGTAFHKVLQSLNENPLANEDLNAVAEDARQRFAYEIEKQEEQAQSRRREQTLPRNDARRERALEAIIAEALRIHHQGIRRQTKRSTMHISDVGENQVQTRASDINNNESGSVEVEVEVKSLDGLLHGRIDRIEHQEDGVRIIDYKSALREELAERYTRQLQLYAFLWFESRRSWPFEGFVIYPLNAATYRVAVDQETCQTVGEEAKTAVLSLTREKHPKQLATPGDVCKACEFRPWCKPFWDWQRAETSESIALKRAEIGFEGEITEIKTVGTHRKIVVSWRTASVEITAPIERFPHLATATKGVFLRILDTRLVGLRHQPRAQISGYSEVFLIV